MKSLRWYSGMLLLAPAALWSQNGAVQDCRENVADALSIATGAVDASLSSNNSNGNPVVEWETSLGGRRIRGFCETNRNGRVTSTQLGRFTGGNLGGILPGIGQNKGAPIAVNVDTSGSGSFSGMGQTVRVTRGWVDTRTEPSVSLSGQGDFKITFYGVVTGSSGEREFTIRINRSDRGNATGTVTVRLNSNRDEVEYINIDGRVGRSEVRGNFNRN